MSASHMVTVGMEGYALAGTLLLPAGASAQQPVAGVVMVGGPDPLPLSRHEEQGGPSWSLAWGQALADAGLAVLCYDQRGSGMSTGAYEEATRGDLYEEARAVTEMLRAQPEVDGQRVAAIGWGEGAGFALALASQGEVAAAVLLAAPYVTAQERYARWIGELAARKGLSQRVVDLRVQSWRQGMEAAREQVSRGVRTTTTDVGGRQMTTNLIRFVENQQFDPRKLLPGLNVPLLLLHGEGDQVIPAAESAEMQHALQQAGAEVARITYQGVEHFLYREQQPLADACAWLQQALALPH